MPDYDMRVVRRCLVNKLGAAETEGRKHRFYDLYSNDGTFLAQTHLSQGRGSIGMSLIAKMASQLGVGPQDFRGAIDCSVEREAFYLLMSRRRGD